MDKPYIENIILDAEASIRTAKATLEKSRDSLIDGDFKNYNSEIKQAYDALKNSIELIENVIKQSKIDNGGNSNGKC